MVKAMKDLEIKRARSSGYKIKQASFERIKAILVLESNIESSDLSNLHSAVLYAFYLATKAIRDENEKSSQSEKTRQDFNRVTKRLAALISHLGDRPIKYLEAKEAKEFYLAAKDFLRQYKDHPGKLNNILSHLLLILPYSIGCYLSVVNSSLKAFTATNYVRYSSATIGSLTGAANYLFTFREVPKVLNEIYNSFSQDPATYHKAFQKIARQAITAIPATGAAAMDAVAVAQVANELYSSWYGSDQENPLFIKIIANLAAAATIGTMGIMYNKSFTAIIGNIEEYRSLIWNAIIGKLDPVSALEAKRLGLKIINPLFLLTFAVGNWAAYNRLDALSQNVTDYLGSSNIAELAKMGIVLAAAPLSIKSMTNVANLVGYGSVEIIKFGLNKLKERPGYLPQIDEEIGQSSSSSHGDEEAGPSNSLPQYIEAEQSDSFNSTDKKKRQDFIKIGWGLILGVIFLTNAFNNGSIGICSPKVLEEDKAKIFASIVAVSAAVCAYSILVALTLSAREVQDISLASGDKESLKANEIKEDDKLKDLPKLIKQVDTELLLPELELPSSVNSGPSYRRDKIGYPTSSSNSDTKKPLLLTRSLSDPTFSPSTLKLYSPAPLATPSSSPCFEFRPKQTILLSSLALNKR
jgi:hypothetical protein